MPFCVKFLKKKGIKKMGNESISLMIIVFCIMMSAYFSATETAFSSLNRIRLKNMAEKGNRRAAMVMKMSENYDVLLSTILIGNNIVNIASASLATVLFVRFLGDEAGASISTIVTTVVVLIFGEVSPKSIAKESPEAFAMFSAPLLRVFTVVLTPFNFFFIQWKKLLSVVFKASEDKGITEEELLTIVEEARQDGGIDEQESSLIRSAIEFTELEAGDIFTPRIDVEAVSVDADQEEIARVFADTGYSRLPVYEGNIDHVVGIVYQKDFHNRVYRTGEPLGDIIKPAMFIARNKKIGALLKELQQNKMHIAVILDEFGGTVGIVTMEDILEELVGEIWDEHDEVLPEIRQISETEYLVEGSASIDKLFDKLHKKQEFEFVTVSGWVMELAGRIPVQGEGLSYENLEITVERMEEKRVKQIRIIVRQATEKFSLTERD